MNIYSLNQLVSLAMTHSPLYKRLYEHLPSGSSYVLADLPILRNQTLMEYVHAAEPDFIFAEGNVHGVIFESSASTGKPKVTIYGRDEWQSMISLITINHWKNGLLKENDRVANLCATPYISYRVVHDVIGAFPGKISEIPLGCDYDYGFIYSVVRKYKSNVLTGINSTFLGLAAYLLKNGLTETAVERLLGGGELLYGAQLEMIKKAFPKADLVSFMYGTTEGGGVAFSTTKDSPSTFRAFSNACIVEIVDQDSDEVILKPNVIGKCVITNLTKSAMPVIRMDTGDFAIWEDDERVSERRFKIVGREFPFYHYVEGIPLNETHIFDVVALLSTTVKITKFQLVINNDGIDVKLSLLEGFFVDECAFRNLVRLTIIKIIPGLKSIEASIDVMVVEFDVFLPSTNRKGRFIVDKRTL